MSPDNSMERTRFFRRPVVWIILVIIGAIALSSFFTSGPSYQRVDTSVALERLKHQAPLRREPVRPGVRAGRDVAGDHVEGARR